MRTLVLTILATCALGGAAFGSAGYLKAFRDTYKPKSDSSVSRALCSTCHAAKGPTSGNHTLNPYGEDLLKAMKADQPNAKLPVLKPEILKKVEDLDSDKDGAKNGVELKADRLPGDKASKP